MIRLRYFGRNRSLTQGTPQDTSVKYPTRLKIPKRGQKVLEGWENVPWRNQASTNYTNRTSPSEKDATEDYFTLRKPKVPGRGGKTCRWRHNRKPRVPSEKKERFASLQIPSERKKKIFFFKKAKWTRTVINFILLPYHYRKCYPEKMMADQELNSRDGRNALRCPDNFIIPYPSPCGLLLQHRADKGQY